MTWCSEGVFLTYDVSWTVQRHSTQSGVHKFNLRLTAELKGNKDIRPWARPIKPTKEYQWLKRTMTIVRRCLTYVCCNVNSAFTSPGAYGLTRVVARPLSGETTKQAKKGLWLKQYSAYGCWHMMYLHWGTSSSPKYGWCVIPQVDVGCISGLVNLLTRSVACAARRGSAL